MSESSMVIVHDARELSPAVARAIENNDWHASIIPTRSMGWQQEVQGVDCVLLVLDSGDAHACKLLIEGVKAVDDNLPILVLSKSRELEHAVEAMKAGAYDYLTYPLNAEKLRHSLTNAIRLYGLTKRIYLLENQMGLRDAFDNMIGRSVQMQEVYNMISMVAKTAATAFITGESGTGKELVAQAIHRHSSRAKRPFIDINCGAIPHELLENELFGHERGAYTGADRKYTGSCERADGGTLFLDEISEMDPLLQVKLLRFIQERSFTRVGGKEPIRVDVRIIVATNRDIFRDIATGRFREDLFYRLNVVPIRMPALRERKEDIPMLAKYFLDKYSSKNEKIFIDFSMEAMEALVCYDWPGNVRELENVIERVVVLGNDSRVKPSHLPPALLRTKPPGKAVDPGSDVSLAPLDGQRILPLNLVEKYAIESALRRCLGNVGETARKLKVGQATLYRKIKEYGLR